jgi:hypothetical protein
MTRDELNLNLVAIITTLNEVDFAPESSLYLGLGMDLAKWELIKSILLGANLATCSNNMVKIAPMGVEMAKKINAAKKVGVA